MRKEPEIERWTTAVDTGLKLSVMLGSLPMTMLPFLLPLYAKQFGANALGIGGLFAVAQGMIGSSRYVNFLGRARLDPGSRTTHDHVWWQYVMCECRLWRARHYL